jgi:type II secretion system protein N
MSVDTDGQKVQFAAHRLDLSLLPLSGTVNASGVQGSLSGEGEIEGNGANLFSWQGQIAFTLTNGALREGKVSGFPLPPLSFVEGRLRATVKNGLLEIPDFTLQADNTEAQLQGMITLNMPLSKSNLNLQMTAKTGGSTSSPLTMLLSLLPSSSRAPGERQASISGSLASPILR